MEVIRTYRIGGKCPYCMEEHDVKVLRGEETTKFKGEYISFIAEYDYCDNADEYYERDEQINQNNISMKNAYRKKVGLLTGDEIVSIRKKYGISQSDLAIVLGCGEKTITRYEGYQVQDAVHDAMIRKVDEDPEWYIELLRKSKDKLNTDNYRKYYACAAAVLKENADTYCRKAIMADYALINGSLRYCGGTALDIDKVVDVIRYFSNSSKTTFLYKVKLMKMLWYADFMSFKEFGHSITGLAYQALPMGAVPVAHNHIVELAGINREEIVFEDGIGIKFMADGRDEYKNLADDDIKILDRVIEVCGKDTKDEIVMRMHSEKAFDKTDQRKLIHYEYAKELSIGV